MYIPSFIAHTPAARFGLLLAVKAEVSQRVQGLACRRVFHVDKEDFLPAFRDTFLDVSLLLAPTTQWESRTPSDTHEFGSQSKFVSTSSTRSPVAAQQGFAQLVKGGELMLHETVLMSSRIAEPEEQLATITRRKALKGKQLQPGSTMEYGVASAQVAAEASSTAQRSKRSRGSEDGERAQSASRRCGLCRTTGHNARTRRNDAV